MGHRRAPKSGGQRGWDRRVTRRKHGAARLADVDKQQEFVLRTLEERDIRFVRLWFTDVLGFLKSVAVAPAELEGAFAEGIGFDGSAIEGFARVYESDMIAKPDPSTFQLMPLRDDPVGVGRMFCDILLPDGSPSHADPRHVLKRALAKAASLGFTFYTHPEIEFFLLREKPEPGGKPQAIDLRYADALSTADNIMSFRLAMKEVALEQGVYATFMPKPFTEHPGSGMHTHMSLFEGDRNVFHDPGGEFQISKVGRAFIAGLLTHAAEITAVCNQWVNSYKRLWGAAERTAGAGGEAPSYVCWGHNNRSALVRVPMYKPHKGNATRIEFRSLDSACNPYLAFAAILVAGLKGIEAGYELPPEAEDDVWALTDRERRVLGIQPLPQSLDEALNVMQDSELMAETLGEHVFDFFLRNKREEWRDYRHQVTAFELDRYLPVL